MDEQTSRLLLGIAAAMTAATLAGVFNYGLIRLLRIPPIIATLSSSFLILSTAISYGRGLRIRMSYCRVSCGSRFSRSWSQGSERVRRC